MTVKKTIKKKVTKKKTVRKKDVKKMGRPTAYKKQFVEEVFKLCKAGFTDIEIADFFKVSNRTINVWKEKYPDFMQSLKDGKREFDNRIEKSLSERAMGYSHKEDKIFNNQGEIIRAETIKHYPPDTTACIFWLKNRNPEKWRDKVDNEHSGGVTVRVVREE